MKPDYSLYLVTDRVRMSTKTLSEAVEQAIIGGCTMIQLREKNISTLDYYNLALDIKKITDKYNIPFIINDRVDIAMAVGADGVHIGQKDIPVNVARKIIGEKMLLGVSVISVKEAVKAVKDGADYLGVGAIFPTKTKSDADFVSIEELKNIRQVIHVPIVVIGGVSTENAMFFGSMGIDGLAVVSAIIAQKEIKQAAETLKLLFYGKCPQ